MGENVIPERRVIPVKSLAFNRGQIEGVPKNPRQIRGQRYDALKKSITDDPEFLNFRELIVYEQGMKFIVLCGNMRLLACKDLGIKEVPCKIIPQGTSANKLRAYAIKDNVAFGQDDISALMSEWDENELYDFGVEHTEKVIKDNKERSEFMDKFNSINNSNAVYPLIPKYDEDNELFIIISDSSVDSTWLRERLHMDKMRSYKSNTAVKSNVISIKDVIKCLSE